MITNEWMLCARGGSIDKGSGELTLFAIVTGIKPHAFPLLIQHITVASCQRRELRDPDKLNARFKASHNDNTLLDQNVTIEFEKKSIHQLAINLQGIILDKPGALIFELIVGRKVLGRCRIDIEDAPMSVANEAPTASTTAASPPMARPKKKRGAKRALAKRGRPR